MSGRPTTAIINWFCDRAAEQGRHVGSVRAICEEGEPSFEASAIRTQSHLQIAVRDPSVVRLRSPHRRDDEGQLDSLSARARGLPWRCRSERLDRCSRMSGRVRHLTE